MNLGIILAAGKGSRINATNQNKTTLAVNGKPLVQYGVDLFAATVDRTLVVIGAFSESVKTTLAGQEVTFAEQTEQKGTGHAVQEAIKQAQAQGIVPEQVFIGYGDHMMHYQPETVRAMLQNHKEHNAAVTLITTHHDNPVALAWGRIIRNSQNYVAKIVEQKDANPEELAVTELNAGFYCFDYPFLARELPKLQPSPVTGEYYLTDLIQVANQQGLNVLAVAVPFEQVGSGVNTMDQLQETDAKLKQA